jgi:hypothetical protein
MARHPPECRIGRLTHFRNLVVATRERCRTAPGRHGFRLRAIWIEA